jgi:hypothetical protein
MEIEMKAFRDEPGLYPVNNATISIAFRTDLNNIGLALFLSITQSMNNGY